MTQQQSPQVPASTSIPSAPRRRFLGASAAGMAAIGAPAVAAGQAPITWRFQSAWPTNFLYQEFAVDWTRKVADLSGGRLKISMLAAGAIVPGLQIVDAASQGVIDGGHGLPGFWFGKNSAFGLYGAGPDFAMNPDQMLGWIEYGGGKELFAEIQAAAKLNLASFLYGPVPCEPMGWFKKEITAPEDLKGLKFRTAGLAVDMFKELGVAAVQMAPADIVPALDRGVLDGAEFASASDDRVMGFSDVAKFYLQQSYHMANNCCEVMINKAKYDALPDDLKMVLAYASAAASADMQWKSMDRMSADFLALQADGKVKAYRTPQPILDAQLAAWDRVVERHANANPLFAKVVESQRAWAQRVVYWHNEVQVSQSRAYAHYFPEGPRA